LRQQKRWRVSGLAAVFRGMKMKIERIRAVNFLSHSDTTVDFRNIDSVVAVGNNGAGKSSLLVDSILCCLFGKGRASDIDSFVRVGRDLMQLEVDFSINGSCYRVIRKRSRKTAKGSSMLELFEIDREGNQVKNLTGGTVAETQALIEKILGINYEVLVKSAIIEQGEADSFVEATPAERMELFSEIWDLKKYEEFSQIARDTVKELSERIKAIDERIGLSRAKIGELAESVKDKDNLEKEIKGMDAQIVELEKKKSELEKKLGGFESLLKEIESARNLKAQAEQELKTIGSVHSSLLSNIERFKKVVKNRDAVLKKVEEEKEKEKVIGELEEELSGLNIEVNGYRDEIDSLRIDFQKKTDRIKEQEKAIDSEISKLRNEQIRINEGFTSLKVKEEKLRRMSLDAEKLKGLRCHPEVDLFYVNEKCIFIKDAVEAKRMIPALEREINEWREVLEKKDSGIQSEIKNLEEKKSEIESEINKMREELDNKISSLEKELNIKKAKAKEVEERIKGIRLELSGLREFTKLAPEINLAEQELPKLIEEEKRLEERSGEIMAGIEKRRKEIEALEKRLSVKEEVEKELRTISSQLADISRRREEVVKRIGFIEAGTKQIEELKNQIEADEKESEEIASKKAIYQTLEEAFKQIPYMLISRSIAVVESKANEILSLISPNGLRVEIKTEKMTKTTKKMKDEIHLIIHDSDGEKPYKFLSGGEKLMVGLALRLGIGRTLLLRRGTKVETLIADEIFGPLDEERLQSTMEMLRLLRKIYGLVVIITHIPETKSLFQTKLVFSKTNNGSSVKFEYD